MTGTGAQQMGVAQRGICAHRCTAGPQKRSLLQMFCFTCTCGGSEGQEHYPIVPALPPFAKGVNNPAGARPH